MILNSLSTLKFESFSEPALQRKLLKAQATYIGLRLSPVSPNDNLI